MRLDAHGLPPERELGLDDDGFVVAEIDYLVPSRQLLPFELIKLPLQSFRMSHEPQRKSLTGHTHCAAGPQPFGDGRGLVWPAARPPQVFRRPGRTRGNPPRV